MKSQRSLLPGPGWDDLCDFMAAGSGATFASRCGDPLTTQFSTENGRAALARHFDDVEQVDLTTQAVFPDYASAQAYLATFDADLAEALPPFAGERGFAGATTVFSCR